LQGTCRFGELRRSLKGVSPKTLKVRLRELEQYGLVVSRIYPEVPPRVEYSLTAKGRGLGMILRNMREWYESGGWRIVADRRG
jgi:DNA-binding HxlR family transcriptional regulator